MSISDVLAPYNISEADFTAALAAILRKEPQPAAAALTAEQENVLARHGGVRVRPGVAGGRDTALAAESNLAEQIRDSISVIEAAARLGIDPSRIRHRIRDRALYAFKLGASLRLPLWQFTTSGEPLPRLRSALEALPQDLHPLEVTGFMTTPDADLTSGDHQLTPQQWLEAGGDVSTVAELAVAVDTW